MSLSLSTKAVCAGLFRQDTFPLRLGGAAGETRRETLLRKASEPAAHVAGFGLYLEGCGPPSLPNGGFSTVRGSHEPFVPPMS